MKNIKNVAAMALLATLVSACSGDKDDTQKNESKNGAVSEATSDASSMASAFTMQNACEIAERKLNAEGNCKTRKLQYNGEDVYVVSMGETNAVVFSDEKTQVLETPLYMDAFNAVQTYVTSMKGPKVTKELFDSAKQDIRLAKRGYILGVHFEGGVVGSVYITPKGRLSGALKEK